MKANAPRRKVFNDAIDLLSDEPVVAVQNMQTMIPVNKIVPFHNHPFRLYEGERLNDMVESIREHGILNPVIVQKTADGYEMLAGHNRWNAAKIVGIKEIPAIVKEGLTEEEAYIYVIETNLIQRSFSDLAITEKAAVLKQRYDKVICQGKRNDILKELELLETCGHGVHKSREELGNDYSLSGRQVARYMRINELIPEFKQMADDGSITFRVAVELSYLSSEEQEMVSNLVKEENIKITDVMATTLKKSSGDLTVEAVKQILLPEKKKTEKTSVFISSSINEKYFSGKKKSEITEIIEQALVAWFGESEG